MVISPSVLVRVSDNTAILHSSEAEAKRELEILPEERLGSPNSGTDLYAHNCQNPKSSVCSFTLIHFSVPLYLTGNILKEQNVTAD